MHHLIGSGDYFVEDRLVNNHLIPLTILSLLYSKLSFGFRISEMIEFTKENIIAQSNAIFSEDELSIFWRIIDYLVAKHILQHNEDIIVQYKRKETVMDDRNRSVAKNTVQKTWEDDRKLLFIRFTKAHPEYQERHQRQRGKNGLDQNALQYYLEQSRYPPPRRCIRTSVKKKECEKKSHSFIWQLHISVFYHDKNGLRARGIRENLPLPHYF